MNVKDALVKLNSDEVKVVNKRLAKGVAEKVIIGIVGGVIVTFGLPVVVGAIKTAFHVAEEATE